MLAFAEWLQTTRLSITIQSVEWIIPLLQTIHILMIGVVLISILVLALRVLGRVRTDQTFAEVWSRFSPWMWVSLVILAITGVILIIGEPVREVTALSFWLKMALIVVAVAVTVTFARALQPRVGAAVAGGAPAGAAVPLGAQEFSAKAKTIALGTLVLWLVIVFLGRAIAYDAAVWGSLSPASGA